MQHPPYANPDELFQAIDQRYDQLSKRLQSIARQLHHHRDHIALMSANEFSQTIDVAPSSLVRFAQSMGFSGYSQLKNLFQQSLAQQIAITDDYAKRIKRIAHEQQQAAENISGSSIVQEVIHNSTQSLNNLFSVQLMQALNNAVDLMINAKSIWIMAAGRSFAASAYLTYLIQHSDKPIHWLNGLCFSLEEKLNSVSEEDLFIVISYAPYADSSRHTIHLAQQKGAKIIAITDSHLSDIGKNATQIIEIQEQSNFGFRALVNTVCVIQSLFLLYATKTELTHTEPKP